MTIAPIPLIRSAEEITPEWATDVLRANGNIVRRIEAFAFKSIRQHSSRAIVLDSNQIPSSVLATNNPPF